MVTLQLNTREALLVRTALEQEIKKGSQTFLSGRDVITLDKIVELLKSKELA